MAEVDLESVASDFSKYKRGDDYTIQWKDVWSLDSKISDANKRIEKAEKVTESIYEFIQEEGIELQ